MNVLLIFFLVAIALLVLWQAGRRAGAGRRTLEEHHRALDTLGQITGHQEEGAAAVVLGRSARSASPAGDTHRHGAAAGSVAAPARPHVKVVATATRAGRAPRWSRRAPVPPGTARPFTRHSTGAPGEPAAWPVPPASPPGLTEAEAEADLARRLSFPSPSVAPSPRPTSGPGSHPDLG
ncbi:MAG TPA: hypothetical protein VKU91_09925, partial [Acidimicrobiales bacterium]|nr:hypothetical protein [Acidimicrobiales bacterium]